MQNNRDTRVKKRRFEGNRAAKSGTIKGTKGVFTFIGIVFVHAISYAH